MLGNILTSLLCVATPASAQQFEVSVNSSLQRERDPRWEKVSATPIHTSTGLTVGMVLADNLSVIMGFNTGKAGSMITVPTGIDGQDSDLGFNLATTVTQYQLGARYRWKWRRRLIPTTTLKANLGHASLRMDEDIENEGDEVSKRYSALAGGFEIAGGLEYTVAFLSEDQVRINVGFEAGYTNLLKLRFNDNNSANDPISVGELNLGGPYMTMYVGSRF